MSSPSLRGGVRDDKAIPPVLHVSSAAADMLNEVHLTEKNGYGRIMLRLRGF